jgi:hypothetical protein
MERSPLENIIVTELIKKSLTVHCFPKLVTMLTTAFLWTDSVLGQFNSVRSYF